MQDFPSFRLWEVRTTVAGVDRQKLHYVYDDAGNVTSIDDLMVSGGTQTQTFTNDALDRLWTAKAAGGSAGQGQYSLESYTYNAIGNMTSKGGVTYYYNYADHKHAVSSTTAGGAFSYDAAGNMTSRKLTTAGPTYTQTWDPENRLASVTVSGATTNFVYDGNGTLVKKVAGGQTTVYVGPHYEKNVTTGTVTKYYTFGAQRIAMNQANVVYYLTGDHLGTTSAAFQIQNNAVVAVSESRHRPYGAERWSSGTLPTEYRFTGQRLVQSLGIYSMGARWYDPALGRWLSADSIVPGPRDPQSLNRYSYVGGNPANATDPTGHCAEGEEEGTCDVDLTLELLNLEEGDFLLMIYGPDGQLWLMLQDIAATEYGSDFVQKVLEEGWTIKSGNPLAGAAFTYPWEVITVDSNGTYQERRGRLAHELVHAALYEGTWANSIRQEFVAEYYEKCVSSQMAPVNPDSNPRVGSVLKAEWENWFGENALSVDEHYERIKNYSDWHRNSLPQEQPTGLKGVLTAIWQGVTFWKAW